MMDLTASFIKKRENFISQLVTAPNNKVAHTVESILCEVMENYSDTNPQISVTGLAPLLMEKMPSVMLKTANLQEINNVNRHIVNHLGHVNLFHRYLWTWAIGVGVASILCALVGLTSLNIISTGILLAITLLTLLPPNYQVRWILPLNIIASRSKLATHMLDTQAKTDKARSLADALEALCRNIDQILHVFQGKLEAETKATLQPQQPSILMEFLQDMAEAASASDAEQALHLAKKRTSAIANALGVEIIEYSPNHAACFLVDVFSDTSEIQTVAPAIVKGDFCLVKGYARGI